MKKYLVLILFIVLCLPCIVKAEIVEISCDKRDVKNGEEINCQIMAKEIDFKTTSLSGKIVLDEQLELISSDYDETVWKILDSEFVVTNMNLISEEIMEDSDYLIAIFKVKAINEETVVSKVKLTDVLIGDENYENHSISVEDYSIYAENEKIVNPSTSVEIPIVVFVSIIGLGLCGYNLIKKKKYI